MSITYEFNIRKQYRMVIINAVLNGNPENVNYVIDFIHNNLHAVLKLYVKFVFLFSLLYIYITYKFI